MKTVNGSFSKFIAVIRQKDAESPSLYVLGDIAPEHLGPSTVEQKGDIVPENFGTITIEQMGYWGYYPEAKIVLDICEAETLKEALIIMLNEMSDYKDTSD